MTAQDLINGSLRLLGVLASGESPQASESNDALTSLNDMISDWSTNRLLIYQVLSETFTLTVNKQSYTWGSGGDFNSARPTKIKDVELRTTNGSTTFDLPVDIINRDQWAAITVKSSTSNIPTRVYPEMAYPLVTMYFWPTPSAANTAVIWSDKPLSSFSLLTSTVDLPPGYARALRYGLALELAPEYGKMPSEVVIARAAESKANIKRANKQFQLLGMDPAATTHTPVFNIYSGESK